VNELAKIDKNVNDKYMIIVNQEKNEISKIQKEINKQNKVHDTYINNLIKDYNISAKISNYIYADVENEIKSMRYNKTYDQTISSVKTKIISDLYEIYKSNDKTYYMKPNKQIDTKTGSKTWDSDQDYMSKYCEMRYKQRYITQKTELLTKCGFINCKSNVINFDVNIDIQFISVDCGSFKFVTTCIFFSDNKLLDMMKKYFLKLYVPVKIEQHESKNLTEIKMTLPSDCKDVTSTITPIFDNILNVTFGKIIMNICNDLKIQYSNAK
jgi:hypothetical protein